MTTLIVPCLILKLLFVLKKLGVKGQDETFNSYSSLNCEMSPVQVV
jgi:hypothetical protein